MFSCPILINGKCVLWVVLPRMSSLNVSCCRTCQARNQYALDNSTIDITVNVPPKWIYEPRNVQVILGKSVTINCQAEGYPKPKIVWKKAALVAPSGGVSSSSSLVNTLTNELMLGEEKQSSAAAASSSSAGQQLQPNEFRDILSNYRYQVFSNGSLYLQEAELTDAGFYMCQVSGLLLLLLLLKLLLTYL